MVSFGRKRAQATEGKSKDLKYERKVSKDGKVRGRRRRIECK